MNEEIKKTSEDALADIDFEDEKEEKELKDISFLKVDAKTCKLKEEDDSLVSEFYSNDEKLVGSKIIHKKSGHIIEITYNFIGGKETVSEYDKEKNLIKSVDYYENGQVKLSTEYGKNGSYKSMMYNVDGSRLSYVEKYIDGTADAIYFDADNKGTRVEVKMDKDKNVIEKKIIK